MHPRRLLIVDDEPSQCKVYCQLFSAVGYKAIPVSSGLEALANIRRFRPDIILADICMPGMDGIKLFKILRNLPETSTIPVVLMTGVRVPASMLQAAAIGLDSVTIHIKGDAKSLVASVEEILSGSSSPKDHLLTKGPVVVDLIHRTVIVSGASVPRLSAKRYDLLLSLLRHDGPVHQNKLLEDVWGLQGDLKSVQVTVFRLRKSLKAFPALQIRTDGGSYRLLILPNSVPELDDGNTL